MSYNYSQFITFASQDVPHMLTTRKSRESMVSWTLFRQEHSISWKRNVRVLGKMIENHFLHLCLRLIKVTCIHSIIKLNSKSAFLFYIHLSPWQNFQLLRMQFDILGRIQQIRNALHFGCDFHLINGIWCSAFSNRITPCLYHHI